MARLTAFLRRLLIAIVSRLPSRVLQHALARQAAKEHRPDEALRRRQSLVRRNSELLDRHRGERCFILCNGPSVKNQDLSRLAGEIVFTVANGYHHPLFDIFRPRYHCVPQVGTQQLTETEITAWFREMESRLGSAELFLSTVDEPLVTRDGLFHGRTLHYLFFNGSFDGWPRDDIIDISRDVPGVQSVPIMGLMIAMYMGFKEIFLLGTDHDHFLTGSYTYFYEPTVLKGKDPSADAQGRVLSPRYDQFHELAVLWRQYRAMRNIAEANGVRILNATYGGALDEFPRVTLEEALARPAPVLARKASGQ
jgi:hypothetical protein